MVGVPVIINHKDITAKNADDERVGVVNSVWYDDKDGWYWCDGIIWDETAQNLITDQNWSVSCSYDVKTANDEGGSENNIKYDMEFLDGVFTHLALVDNPRYERANIVFNSKTEIINNEEQPEQEENIINQDDIVNNALTEVIIENCLGELQVQNDKWITVHPNGEDEEGRHLLLKGNETPKEAMKRQWGVDVEKKKIDKKTADYTKKLGVKVAKMDDFSPEIIESINEALETLPEKDRPEYITSFKNGNFYRELAEQAKRSFGLSWNTHNVHKGEDGTYFSTDTAVFFNSKYKNLSAIEKKKKEYNENNSRNKPWYFNTNGKATFFHEMGHQYEKKYGIDEEFKKLADKWANSTPYQNIKNIEYGRVKEGQGANYKEAFAEAWAAYYTKNPELPTYIKEYFDKKDFKNTKSKELPSHLAKLFNSEGENSLGEF